MRAIVLERPNRDHQEKDTREKRQRDREVEPVSGCARWHAQGLGADDAHARENQEPGARRTHLVLPSGGYDDKRGARVWALPHITDLTRAVALAGPGPCAGLPSFFPEDPDENIGSRGGGAIASRSSRSGSLTTVHSLFMCIAGR